MSRMGSQEDEAMVRDQLIPYAMPTIFECSRTFFYPWGNTPPVYLTQHTPPLDSSVLLLGCGDLRNVLYTLVCEQR